MSASTLVVTGGTGFIGGALVRSAAQKGWSVVALTRSEVSPASRAPVEGVEFRTLRNPDELGRVLQDVGPFRLVHAASPGVMPGDRSWSTLVDGCVSYTLALVEAASALRAERIVNTSSWSAYAAPCPEDQAIDEGTPLNPTNLYGAAKASAEVMGAALARSLGAPFYTARLFNVYGPGEAGTRLLPHVLSHLRRGETVSLTPGLQRRDFVYIDDVVDALLLLVSAENVNDTAYNICTGRAVSVRALVEKACDALSAPRSLLKFGALPGRHDEPPSIIGNPARIERDLGWTAQISLEGGLTRFIERTVAGEVE